MSQKFNKPKTERQHFPFMNLPMELLGNVCKFLPKSSLISLRIVLAKKSGPSEEFDKWLSLNKSSGFTPTTRLPAMRRLEMALKHLNWRTGQVICNLSRLGSANRAFDASIQLDASDDGRNFIVAGGNGYIVGRGDDFPFTSWPNGPGSIMGFQVDATGLNGLLTYSGAGFNQTVYRIRQGVFEPLQRHQAVEWYKFARHREWFMTTYGAVADFEQTFDVRLHWMDLKDVGLFYASSDLTSVAMVHPDNRDLEGRELQVWRFQQHGTGQFPEEGLPIYENVVALGNSGMVYCLTNPSRGRIKLCRCGPGQFPKDKETVMMDMPSFLWVGMDACISDDERWLILCGRDAQLYCIDLTNKTFKVTDLRRNIPREPEALTGMYEPQIIVSMVGNSGYAKVRIVVGMLGYDGADFLVQMSTGKFKQWDGKFDLTVDGKCIFWLDSQRNLLRRNKGIELLFDSS